MSDDEPIDMSAIFKDVRVKFWMCPVDHPRLPQRVTVVWDGDVATCTDCGRTNQDKPRATCPHGDPACRCSDDWPCRYEGLEAWRCPNPPPLPACEFDTDGDGDCPTCARRGGCPVAHCHVEGCTWRYDGAGRTHGRCGLLKLGLPPVVTTETGERFWSMAQARPGLPGWACGWLRTPLNVSSRGWEEDGA